MAIDDAALADAHPLTPSAASTAAPAIPRTAVSLRMVTGYSAGRGGSPPRPSLLLLGGPIHQTPSGGPIPPDPLGGPWPPDPGGPVGPRPRGARWPQTPGPVALGSAAVEGGAEQAERRGTEVQHRLVETLQREVRAPVLPRSLAELEDLQLAPGVPAVGRVEGGPAGLGQRRRSGQVGIGLEPPGRLLDRHPGRVHADGARQPCHPDQRLQPDADGDRKSTRLNSSH